MKKIVKLLFFTVIAVFSLTVSVSAKTAGRVTTESGRLNLRQSPSTASSVVGSIAKGSWVTVEKKEGNWYFIEYEKGRRAYASAAYITDYPKTVEGEVNAGADVLNVRTGPGTGYAVKDRLKTGQRVLAVKSNSDWAGIVYDGNKTGYVAKAYLRRLTENGYPGIKLQVPSFKQYDSRWKNYPLGLQGDTIGTIGCLTTAIAMTESHRAGYEITPLQMAKKLSYSASGSLYWPADYVRSSASGDYLQSIYSLLRSGKTVIFGAKRASGGQHWVTVYGYEGEGSLTAGDFLVHDPGSERRFTLQDLLNAYPYPDRYVYKK